MMNERIKELFKQAANKDFPTGVANIHSNELERFAELIVRECLVLCQANDVVIDRYSEDNDIGINFGVQECVSSIKQYFGVKE